MPPKTDPRGREYGRRLIPQLIDDIASTDPLREAFQFPRTNDPKDGWQVMTFREYANAINRCATMIIEKCGEAAEGSFPTIAYIGPQDARYVVMIFAAVKVGYRVGLYIFLSFLSMFVSSMGAHPRTIGIIHFTAELRAGPAEPVRESRMPHLGLCVHVSLRGSAVAEKEGDERFRSEQFRRLVLA
jgi:hypothetical protein